MLTLYDELANFSQIDKELPSEYSILNTELSVVNAQLDDIFLSSNRADYSAENLQRFDTLNLRCLVIPTFNKRLPSKTSTA